MVVAIDVLEHIHPDELPGMLDKIDGWLKPGGTLVLHASWGGENPNFPQHYNHQAILSPWLERFERTGPTTWRKADGEKAEMCSAILQQPAAQPAL